MTQCSHYFARVGEKSCCFAHLVLLGCCPWVTYLLSVLSNLEMVERAPAMAARINPPATTLLSKFLKDGETVAASAAGMRGLPKAAAELTKKAA
mmetsp:Transcript_19898/g.42152  ORF Transcript_19898/g.42152 Transcript_19898/m.42152 type:complete len:94 (+) Transcript_19898:36-317(+)